MKKRGNVKGMNDSYRFDGPRCIFLGGGNGGNRAYKKRWFVLTNSGRVLYFKNSTSCVALGQFSLYNVRRALLMCAVSDLNLTTGKCDIVGRY